MESDEQIMVNYRDTGDERYFTILHGRHHTVTHGFIVKYLRNRDTHLADDVSQETWMNVSRYRGQYDGRPFMSWLMSIAAYEAVRAFRRRGTKKRGGDREIEPIDLNHHQIGDDRIDTPHDAAASADDRLALRRLAASLPHADARIIQSIYFGGKTIKATAQDMGMPEGTVKTRLNRALTSLRSSLEHGDSQMSATG